MMKEPRNSLPRRGMTRCKRVTIAPKEIVYNDGYLGNYKKRLKPVSGNLPLTPQQHIGILKTNKNNIQPEKVIHNDYSVRLETNSPPPPQDIHKCRNAKRIDSNSHMQCDRSKEQMYVPSETKQNQSNEIGPDMECMVNSKKPPTVTYQRRSFTNNTGNVKSGGEIEHHIIGDEAQLRIPCLSHDPSMSFHDNSRTQSSPPSQSQQKANNFSHPSEFSTCKAVPVSHHLESVSDHQQCMVQPPPGYFIRDDISTEEELTNTICCNQHGERIADDVPLCTFGYQSWSNSPYYCEMSPDGDSNMTPRSDNGASENGRKKRVMKKMKKPKRRRRTKSLDNSENVRKSSVDRATRNTVKSEGVFKRGVTPKRACKKENTQLQRYKQRVLNPRNPKLFQIMGTLPVSMDSILYYYEPNNKSGKSKAKNGTGVKSSRKRSRSRENSHISNTSTINKGKKLLCRNNSQLDDISHLNTNENANNSDVDLSELQSPTITPAQSCTRQSGATHLPQPNDIEHCSRVGELLPGDYSSVCYDEMDLSAKTNSELGKANETKSGPYNIDTVVEDFIQNAYKEETEYEQTVSPERLDPTLKQNDEHTEALSAIVKNSTIVTMPPKSHKIALKKSTLSDKEKCKTQERSKLFSKVPYPKSDAVNSPRSMRKKSLSTPNISVGQLEEQKYYTTEDLDNGFQSPMSSLLQAQKEKCDNETMLCKSQTSPQLAYISSDTVEIIETTHEQSQEKVSISQSGDGSVSLQTLDDDSSDKSCQRERGRLKKSSQKTGSILRKPNTSLEDKRTQSQQQKPQIKTKPSICFTKSHSLSPVYKKKPATQGSTAQATKKSKEANDMPKKAGKKTKKKVRIVVDVNGIQPDKITTDDDAFEIKDTITSQPEGFDEEEIEDNHAYLDGLLEKCKSEHDPMIIHESGTDEMGNEIQNDEDEKDPNDLAFCGFSETNSDQESLGSPKVKEVSAPVHKKKVKKNKHSDKEKEKAHVAEKERTQAEKGWDSNFIVQKEDSKTKVMLKKKRYQLKKANDVEKLRSEVDDIGYLEKQKSSSEVDGVLKKGTANKFQKGASTVKKRAGSPKMSKKNLDPLQLKHNSQLDPKEGSSVDAPGFNKKELGVRVTKSGPAVSLSKQTTKENLINSVMNIPTNRVKMARENFSKISRKRSPSPAGERVSSSGLIDQVSPLASRSTDLDLAFSCRRQQISPGRAAALGRLARRDSKIGHGSKYRSKSESEDYKQKADSSCGKGGSSRLQHADPMDMNVLNLGLNWMIQGLIRRFSIFNKKPEEQDSMSSPVAEQSRDFESALV